MQANGDQPQFPAITSHLFPHNPNKPSTNYFYLESQAPSRLFHCLLPRNKSDPQVARTSVSRIQTPPRAFHHHLRGRFYGGTTMTTLRSLETVPGGSTTPTMSSKLLPPPPSLSQKPVKPTVPIAPRIDVEPIYTALKAAVGRNWNLYLETVKDYLTGMWLFTSSRQRLKRFRGRTRISTANCHYRPPEPTRSLSPDRSFHMLRSRSDTSTQSIYMRHSRQCTSRTPRAGCCGLRLSK